MLIEWLLAGWKIKLGLAVWLGLAAGGVWKRNAIARRGRLHGASSVGVFCLFTAVLAVVLTRRVMEYRRVVKESGIEYTITAGASERIRAAPGIELESRDWPCWRGLAFDNHSRSDSAPIHWGPEQNVIWRAAVPGRGHSSPILCGQYVFLTTADDKTQTQTLLAYDRDDGSLLWERVIHQGRFAPQHAKNTYASATPACDGKHIFTMFEIDGTVVASAVDFAGHVVWQQPVGKYSSAHGYCTSPLLYRSVVITAMEGEISRRLVAYDRSSGTVQWQTEFNYVATNHGAPVILDAVEPALLVLPGVGAVRAFEPDSGKLKWSIGWSVNAASNSAAVRQHRVFASGTIPQNTLVCIEIDSRGAH
ncbi:MAG: PQQ-binding-like beta-propeller repeat protein [Planctomycetia bacterium]|nr:PQQ-binding-like beta-propeller repeat protein [Planctomycetia bacterium]